jgi:hypothetical protein
LKQVFVDALQPNSFPVFCSVLIGGSTALELPIRQILSALTKLSKGRLRTASRFLAALISATYSFHLLNLPDAPKKLQAKGHRRTESRPRALTNHHHPLIPPSVPPLPAGIETPIPPTTPQAGKTIDLTLFTLVRAADAICTLSPAPSSLRLRRIYDLLAKYSAPGLFAASCALIMHAFFYSPLRLPGTYVRWISRIAGVDPRLVHALRQARFGRWQYGKSTGMEPLLHDFCIDLKLSPELGDPAKTIPVSCELVHHGIGGSSCEIHALKRWWRSWVVSLGVYVPLAAIILVRRLPRASKGDRRKVVLATAKSAGRSSAFLATFVSLFYYGVCLSRTRLGPKLFPQITAQEWDAGLCIDMGCLLCGWSVLVETGKRQAELMLFVLPRALATITGRRYDARQIWIEHMAFATSAAVVLTAARDRKDGVRGILGGVLSLVYGT